MIQIRIHDSQFNADPDRIHHIGHNIATDHTLMDCRVMIASDVEVEGKGIILISSEEGETEGNNEKFLKDLGIVDGSILTCDDFLQSYTLKVN